MILVQVFIYGLIIGSFLNVCIYRIPRNEEIVYTPSHCMTCGNKVKWFDLIPVFSFIFLRGKCRHCGTKLSYQYPIVEAINGVAYLLIFMYVGVSWEAIMLSVAFSSLLVISFIDMYHKIIPDKILLFDFVLGVFYVFFVSKTYLSSIIGFFAVSSILYLIAVLSKGQMGGGDIKLMAVFGFILGWKDIVAALMIGSIIGSIIGIFLIATRMKKRNDLVPFGPYLCSGILIAALFGEQIFNWYMNLVLM